MLAASWKDPEDSLIFESALEMRADAIVTRNQKDFESSVIKVVDCDEILRLDAQGLRIGLRRGGHLARCVIGRI